VSLGRSTVCLLLCALLLWGCGAPNPREQAISVTLQPGQRYRMVEEGRAGRTPSGLEASQDGLVRLPRWGASQPVVPVSLPSVIIRRVTGPGPLTLETGFGVLPAKETGPGEGARFVITLTMGRRTREVLRQEVRGSQTEDMPWWNPTRLELPARAGEEIELQFSVDPLGGQRPKHVSAVWVNPTIIAPTPQPKPNLVVVVLDAVRADHLGCYGYARPTSPQIDRLAAKGVQFQEATAQGTYTLASVLSLLTSSYPLLAGNLQDLVRSDGAHVTALSQVDLSGSLPSELRRLGYTTLGCVGGGYVNAAFGFSSGFDWYWTPPTDQQTFLPDHLSVLQRRLATPPAAPFFLLLHTYEAHNYLQGWQHELKQFDHGYRGRLRDKKTLFAEITEASAAGLSPADVQYASDLYDGEIRRTDREIGAFLDWLRAQPWGRNTVLVLTADHGELFGEHGLMHHFSVPYRAVTRVPLVVVTPNELHPGRRISEPVALADLLPTLLELAGGKAPAGTAGRSLAPLFASADSLPEKPTCSEGPGPSLQVRAGRWTYLTWLGQNREELYDVVADPKQQTNLAARLPAEVMRLRRLLAEEMMRAGRGYRLVAAGSRPNPVTVDLTSEAGFAFLFSPTARSVDQMPQPETKGKSRRPAPKDKRIRVTFPAGSDPCVLLFVPNDGKRPVRLEARSGDASLPASCLHLGAKGAPPSALPLQISGVSPSPGILLAADVPVPSSLKEWGLWLWSPTSAATRQKAAAQSNLPEDVRRQLKSLGYVK
jgi:arylsulfatase A-like enzyme